MTGIRDEWHCVLVLCDVLRVDRSQIIANDGDVDIGYDHLIGPEQCTIQAE